MRLRGFGGSVRKLILAAVALAAGTASVACCDGYQPGGVSNVSVAGDGTVIADNPPSVSADGGLTWVGADERLDWGYDAGINASVETPRGTYFIEGAVVYREAGGARREAYSAAHLSQSANRWAQALDAPSCEPRLTTHPQDITYDPASGNVIVAMGLMGVAVGLPSGEWREVGVGWSYPRDFSFAAKLGLLTENGFWAGALAAAFAVGGVAVVFYALRGERAGIAALIGTGYVLALPMSAAVPLIAVAFLFGRLEQVLFALLAAGAPLFALTRARASPFRRGIALGCFVAGAVLGAAALLPYSVRDHANPAASFFGGAAWDLGAYGVILGGVGLALAALAWRRLAIVASAVAAVLRAAGGGVRALDSERGSAGGLVPARARRRRRRAVALLLARGLGTAGRVIPRLSRPKLRLRPRRVRHYTGRETGADSPKSEGNAK